jgi:hypothetical protein
MVHLHHAEALVSTACCDGLCSPRYLPKLSASACCATTLSPLSAGEQGNDKFLLDFGYVPPGNPHDSVEPFPSLNAALEWHAQIIPRQVSFLDVLLHRTPCADYRLFTRGVMACSRCKLHSAGQ